MDHFPRLSELGYMELCRKIGSPTEVRIRRECMDMEEEVKKPMFNKKGIWALVNGSRREGFRLSSSDVDLLTWSNDYKVICDLSQISFYVHRISQYTVILMNCDRVHVPPGYTILKVICASEDENISPSRVYIPSAKFRQKQSQNLKSTCAITSYDHGPCSTYNFSNYLEIDFAFSFRSHHWPPTAQPWIKRCCQQGWPSQTVVSDIIKGGFHVVPIGSTPENKLDWRISFSRAENKLVYSMNHCQFLCLGLLKFFLKEVINLHNNSPVLCSYYVKTCVLWIIQNDNSVIWSPANLMSCFWKCFKLVIFWVRIGECPNFFIPQNNMFRLKIVGSVQASMFSQLYDLYSKGVSCLLLSSTLRPCLSKNILYISLRSCGDESSIISNSELDVSFFRELQTGTYIDSIEEFQVYMKHIMGIILRNLTPYQLVTIQYITSSVLRNSAFLIQRSINPRNQFNTIQYKTYKVCSVLLNISCKYGCASDILYLALYFYSRCIYEHSLNCLQKAQERMTQSYIMYPGNVNVNMVVKDLGDKIRGSVMDCIVLSNENITELVLEQTISKMHGLPVLLIPLRVMIQMLFTLNHHRLGDKVRSQQSLKDLKSLLVLDDRMDVPIYLKDISWQILGICQHITGDLLESLESFQYSLQQKPFHKIKEATILRINTFNIRQ